MARSGFLAVVVLCSMIAGGLYLRTGLAGPVPTPSPRDDPNWMACHAKHVEWLKEADEAEEGFHLLFYGDSITEDWMATDHCISCLGQPRCDGVPDVFKRHYSKWRAGVLAIGGDQTAHLLWRLRNGEVPVKRQPKVVVMLIGTNDLGAAVGAAADVRQAVAAAMLAVPGIMLRLLQTLHTLKDMMPNTHVVVLGVLPRGGPGPAGLFAWPSAFTEAAEIINSHFRDFVALDGHLHFIDCADRFLMPNRRAINKQVMQDALHPNAAGHELLAQCLDPLITKLMQRPVGPSASLATEATGDE